MIENCTASSPTGGWFKAQPEHGLARVFRPRTEGAHEDGAHPDPKECRIVQEELHLPHSPAFVVPRVGESIVVDHGVVRVEVLEQVDEHPAERLRIVLVPMRRHADLPFDVHEGRVPVYCLSW